jgi:very-short-patch-repair endonuclease
MTVKQVVRYLRRQLTPTERLIWNRVRNHYVLGYKINRQHPIRVHAFDGTWRFFVADFCCHAAKLVIEIDGMVHERQKDYDELRTQLINSRGFRVIRFTNNEVAADPGRVIEEIKKQLTPSPSRTPVSPSLTRQPGKRGGRLLQPGGELSSPDCLPDPRAS